MGGGGAMRTAAKFAGIGVVSGARGGISSAPSSTEHSVRNASRPVSTILTSSQGGGAPGGVEAAGQQRPSWELDDWEFAGGEEDLLGNHRDVAEPMPRVVFGAAPSLQEAKSATNDLVDALDKAFLSSNVHTGSAGSVGVNQLSAKTIFSNSDYVETTGCIIYDPKAVPEQKHAVKAFKLLNESPAVQTVVASIASDPNVWNAVLQNEALASFIKFQKTNTEPHDMEESPMKFSDAESVVSGYPGKFTESPEDTSETVESQSRAMDILENIKKAVMEMASNVSSFVQNIFGFSPTGTSSDAADKSNYTEKTLGASFMALAVMVIMVVVLKRG